MNDEAGDRNGTAERARAIAAAGGIEAAVTAGTPAETQAFYDALAEVLEEIR